MNAMSQMFTNAINAKPDTTYTVIAEDKDRNHVYHVTSADMRIVRMRIEDAKQNPAAVWVYAIDNTTGEIVAE